MFLFQGADYLLWKTIKIKKSNESNDRLDYYDRKMQKEVVIFPNEMICRVCTLPADILISEKISDDLGSVNILTALRIVANILIYETDEFPKYICKICLEQLKIALNFKKKCEASDCTFRQSSTKRNNVSVNGFGTMVFHDFRLILRQMREKKLSLQSIKVKNENNNANEDIITPSFIKRQIPKEILIPASKTTCKKNRCKQCDLTFNSKELLIEHRRKRSCMYHPCTLCGKLVTNLARHQKEIHMRTQSFTCHVCGKMTNSAATLRNHLLVHTEKGFFCALCPYKGKRKSYLALHMRTHTGERPYLCSACPAKFVNQSNLRKHQLTHSIKKFECHKCKKQFRLQKTLQEHYDAAHLNMRYRCSICGRDLWTRRKLLSHELNVHKREKHKLYEETQKVVVNDQND